MQCAVTAAQIQSAYYSFEGPEWVGISEPGKDLICRLVTANPKDRLTAEEALAHPFCTGVYTTAATATSTPILNSNSANSGTLKRPMDPPAHPHTTATGSNSSSSNGSSNSAKKAAQQGVYGGLQQPLQLPAQRGGKRSDTQQQQQQQQQNANSSSNISTAAAGFASGRQWGNGSSSNGSAKANDKSRSKAAGVKKGSGSAKATTKSAAAAAAAAAVNVVDVTSGDDICEYSSDEVRLYTFLKLVRIAQTFKSTPATCVDETYSLSTLKCRGKQSERTFAQQLRGTLLRQSLILVTLCSSTCVRRFSICLLCSYCDT
jgi:hypothetical protein